MPSISKSGICFFFLIVSLTPLIRGAIIVSSPPTNYLLRKCCAYDEYYNLLTQECVSGGDLKEFKTLAQNRLVKGPMKNIFVVTGRLEECPETGRCFETNEIVNDKTHSLTPSGVVKEHFFDASYDLGNYCVEKVGNNAKNTTLAIAFCLPETNILPKCCPANHYFDTFNFRCVKYPAVDKSEDLLRTYFYFNNEIHLRYEYDLQCPSAFPVRVNLKSEAYIDECQNVCLKGLNKCFNMRNFCLDNTFNGRLVPSAYICAENGKKACCQNSYYERNEIECSCSRMEVKSKIFGI